MDYLVVKKLKNETDVIRHVQDMEWRTMREHYDETGLTTDKWLGCWVDFGEPQSLQGTIDENKVHALANEGTYATLIHDKQLTFDVTVYFSEELGEAVIDEGEIAARMGV